MEVDLTLEQRFALRLYRRQLETLSRQELLEHAIEEREARLLLERLHQAQLEDMGVPALEEHWACFSLPETEEELIAVFGRVPSDEDLSVYINERIAAQQAAARMDVDIEAIALGAED